MKIFNFRCPTKRQVRKGAEACCAVRIISAWRLAGHGSQEICLFVGVSHCITPGELAPFWPACEPDKIATKSILLTHLEAKSRFSTTLGWMSIMRGFWRFVLVVIKFKNECGFCHFLVHWHWHSLMFVLFKCWLRSNSLGGVWWQITPVCWCNWLFNL